MGYAINNGIFGRGLARRTADKGIILTLLVCHEGAQPQRWDGH